MVFPMYEELAMAIIIQMDARWTVVELPVPLDVFCVASVGMDELRPRDKDWFDVTARLEHHGLMLDAVVLADVRYTRFKRRSKCIYEAVASEPHDLLPHQCTILIKISTQWDDVTTAACSAIAEPSGLVPCHVVGVVQIMPLLESDICDRRICTRGTMMRFVVWFASTMKGFGQHTVYADVKRENIAWTVDKSWVMIDLESLSPDKGDVCSYPVDQAHVIGYPNDPDCADDLALKGSCNAIYASTVLVVRMLSPGTTPTVADDRLCFRNAIRTGGVARLADGTHPIYTLPCSADAQHVLGLMRSIFVVMNEGVVHHALLYTLFFDSLSTVV